MTTNTPIREITLRYAGRCVRCETPLAVGSRALHDQRSKAVTCRTCFSRYAVAASPPTTDPSRSAAAEGLPFAGTAGGSAQREHDRRAGKRAADIRRQFPVVGDLYLRFAPEPQSTRSWDVGASGERALGSRLDALVSPDLFVLHDRRRPRTRANIDHLVIAPAGVFVIDAKKYSGKPTLKVEGGIIRPRTEKLEVERRDLTKVVDAVRAQVRDVQSVLDSLDLRSVPVKGVLCFVGADWPLFGGDFMVDGVHVVWPRKAAREATKPGYVDRTEAELIFRALASAMPPA